MARKCKSIGGVALAGLLLFWIASLGSSAAAQPPNVAILGLEVSGFSANCGATAHPGDQVCVDFTIDQMGNAFVFVAKNGGTPMLVAFGANAPAGEYLGCLPPEGSDVGPRTITVLINNANGSGSNICNYTLAAATGGGPAPTVSIQGLLVNGVLKSCGATVSPGDQVCVVFTTSQAGTGVASVTKSGSMNIVATGSVTGGIFWVACVTAGADPGQRTITVQVINNNGTGQDTCMYAVP